mgnify:CR=1 FL=1
MFNLMFLCTGNSCRSQMAEGWARLLGQQDGDDGGSGESAGSEAHGESPRAGAALSGQESTCLSADLPARADLVVSGCGHADEQCPALPAGTRTVHWPLDDPAKARGTEDEIMQTFRHCRDDIRARVDALLAELRKG